MTIRRLSTIVSVSALAVTLAACNRGGADTTGSGDSPEAGDAAGQTITLAVSTLNNPFFVDLRDGAQEAADEAGVTLNVVDAQNDPATQANQIADAVTQNVAAVVINPVDSDAAGSAVGPANNADIPVVAVDRAVNGGDVASLVSSDNVQGGELAAQTLAEAMGGSGEVLTLQGVPGTSASRDRGEGFTQGIEGSGVTIAASQPANFDRTEGLDVATNLLQANSGATGIFAENDEMALGAIQALGARAGSEVMVFGFDGTDDGLKAVEGGQMVGTIAQQPKELGKVAIQTAIRTINGETVEAEIPVEVKVVTKDNVNEFLQ
ncbi:MAG: D-ribose ABC transporter substrate-binding protein [Mobilicoccus sp.]|nr:D-ribose ABC transporter substrate-binding protein [Mobilicoccus sp.]